jgi:NAD(P)-dependent dehydrogenase (short-subunit alcohol dehydrogenase family)
MSDMFSLQGKVAVVVGGAGGIGQILAEGLGKQGAKVAIADIAFEKGEQIAKNIQAETKNQSAAFKVDLTSDASVVQLAKDIIAKFGTIDILVNAQGLNAKHNVNEFPSEVWDKLFAVNVKSVMLCLRELGKVMIANKKGKIINLSSVRGIRATAWDGNEGYCATKGAVDMITRAAASELAKYNINVNAIGPSTINTPFSKKTLEDPARLARFMAACPLKRVGEPADLVGACIFLASPASDYITGQIIYLDGGLTAIG